MVSETQKRTSDIIILNKNRNQVFMRI